ncbi:DDE-type integrase/transposase/recombinase [Glaciibacter psychrotolerans]|uniref:Transposase InsO family protein n=1 Tax=Glaciibacter psychrotolerans TaxID=670054 RepID=A0A7Z0EGH4_9MICO|nr:DDE-type integrase/transposase/recombinase [Leifsonia psychrotolerans]NYJ21120.1 transposase InsO family protein [Leifsonia psychrotolerans]
MPTLDTNAPILLDDGEHVVVQCQNPFVRLRRTADGEMFDLNFTELARRQVGIPATIPIQARALDALSPAAAGSVNEWLRNVVEVLTGCTFDGTPLAGYDPSTISQNQRVEMRISELVAAGKSVSRATFMRKIKAYREHGAAALIDGRSIRQGGPFDMLNTDVFDALCTVIANQTSRSTGTKSRLIIETRALLIKQFGSNAPVVPPPASMYRYIDTLTKGKHTTGSASTRRSLADRPQRQFGFNFQALAGAEVQVDSTPMDILVKSPSGEIVRPVLTIMLDVATRSILASSLRMEATKGTDHVTLLAEALVPPANRPDLTLFRRMLQDRTPGHRFLDADERRALESKRPYIYPRRIMMDNGKDYISSTFLAAAAQFGIDITTSAPRTPVHKAMVERMFGSINSLFTQHLPGYVGRSPEFRGNKVEEEPLLHIFALRELFDDWVLKNWQNRPHSSLRDPLSPTVLLTPNQMCAQASELTSTLHLPLTEDDFITLLPTSFRTIRSTGIEFNSRVYDSRKLDDYRGKKSNDRAHKGFWEVKSDPYRPLQLWVRSPEHKWIACRARDEEVLLAPHTAGAFIGRRNTDREDVAIMDSLRVGVPMHGSFEDDAPTEETIDTPSTPSSTASFDTFNPDED